MPGGWCDETTLDGLDDCRRVARRLWQTGQGCGDAASRDAGARRRGGRAGAQRLQLVGLHRRGHPGELRARRPASRSPTTCSTATRVLETKLVSGNTGYDVVVPSLTFLARQIQAGVFMPLDKTKLPQLRQPRSGDPGDHRQERSRQRPRGELPVGHHRHRLQRREDQGNPRRPDAPVDSWDLVFKPENLAKLKECGVYFLDTPSEIIPTVLQLPRRGSQQLRRGGDRARPRRC